jgi:hypothetical protein
VSLTLNCYGHDLQDTGGIAAGAMDDTLDKVALV